MATIMVINIAMPIAMTDETHKAPNPLQTWGAALGISALAILIIAVQLGQAAMSSKQWESALIFPTSDSKASAMLASAFFAADDKDAAEKFANKALGGALTHVEAVRTLGIMKFEAGQAKDGKRLVHIANELSWRDSPTQAWLFEQSLIDGQYNQSIRHADALLRRQRARGEIFNIFTLAALEPELADTVRQQIASNPPWRRSFFSEADKVEPSQYRGFDNIIIGLKGGNAPVTEAELVPYITMLTKTGDTARAIKTWTNLFPSQSSLIPVNGSLTLNWPDGERIDRPFPTDWKFRSTRSVTVGVLSNINDDQVSLELGLDRRAIGTIARRAMIVPPGQIDLKVATDAIERKKLNNLRWFFKCISTGDEKAAEINLLQNGADVSIWTGEVTEKCAAYNLIMAVKLGGLSGQTDITINSITITHRPL